LAVVKLMMKSNFVDCTTGRSAVADAATLSFYASKAGTVSVSYQGWDASKVVLEGGRCCGGYRIESVDPPIDDPGL